MDGDYELFFRADIFHLILYCIINDRSTSMIKYYLFLFFNTGHIKLYRINLEKIQNSQYVNLNFRQMLMVKTKNIYLIQYFIFFNFFK